MTASISNYLRFTGLNETEIITLMSITKVCLQRDDLISYVSSMSHPLLQFRLTTQQCNDAIENLIRGGLISETTTEQVDWIHERLKRWPHMLGPFDALPDRMDVDLTTRGAAVWLRAVRAAFGSWLFPIVTSRQIDNDGRREVIATCSEGLIEFAVEALRLDAAKTSDAMVRTGAWRDRWWWRLPSGYRICISENDAGKCQLIDTGESNSEAQPREVK